MTTWAPVSVAGTNWNNVTAGVPGSIWDGGASIWDANGNVGESIWDVSAVSTVWTPVT